MANNVSYVQANAEALLFPDNHFDVITIGFGLRNVTDKDKALASMFRVLKPGGRLLVLEFSKPVSEVIAKLYDLYSFKLLPKMGEIVANDSESYKYLAESIRMHPDQQTLAGHDGECRVRTGGVLQPDPGRGRPAPRLQVLRSPMPMDAMVTAVIETSLNQLLALDKQSPERLAQADGQGTQTGAARAQAALVCLLGAPSGCAGQV